MKKVVIAVLSSSLLAASLIAHAAPQSHGAAHPTHVITMKKTALVNLNTANAMQLEKLPGIGPKIAAEIIKNRPYKNAADVQSKVKGIGAKVWHNIEALVTFK